MYILGLSYLGCALFKSLLGVQIVIPEQLELPFMSFPSFPFDGKQKVRQSSQNREEVEDCGRL